MLGGLLLVAAAPSRAEVIKLQAELKGSNEVPPKQFRRFRQGRGHVR